MNYSATKFLQNKLSKRKFVICNINLRYKLQVRKFCNTSCNAIMRYKTANCWHLLRFFVFFGKNFNTAVCEKK
jgi:hypothetical protein